MEHNTYLYILVMAGVTYLVRMLPFSFIRSFLYYVPYVTLAVMTFPAILSATASPISGLAALLAGIAAAWFGRSLLQVSVICCAVVFVLEFFV